MRTVRPAVLAGTWYPGQADRLRAAVDGYLGDADPARRPPGVPAIVLAPHAGYEYSGPTAGKAYGLLRDRTYDAVFILAPSHRAPLERPALSSAEAFATPLGEVPVATGLVRRLLDGGHYVLDDEAHAHEHAIEIHLPFIQRTLPAGTPIVPILVPPLPPERRRAAAAALAPWRDGRHLLLVSSDLTHYGRAYGYVPFDEDVAASLERLDTGALLRFLARDPDGLLDYREATGITMCGLDAAALALDGESGEHHAELVDYARSGDREGDHSMSVSYAAAIISRPDQVVPLSPDERGLLVELARRSVRAAAGGDPAPDPASVAAESGRAVTDALQRPRGAFVTLMAPDGLRGCIGTITSQRPLVDTVVSCAADAALEDPRFPPVTPGEVDALHVEVSALTPPREVEGPDAITVGRHGVVLVKGAHRAVFLPQVAPEQGWDLPTTLSQLALKAGLDPEGWRRGCRLEVFEAEICKE